MYKTNLANPIYDQVIGYIWPGGDSKIEYFQAKARASFAGFHLADLLISLKNQNPRSIDIMNHSMGTRVTFLAMEQIFQKEFDPVINNHFMMASAVDNESLESIERYFVANSQCSRAFVFHSKNDPVLNWGYRFSEFDRALGLSGPENPADVGRHVHVINCKKIIKKHGSYKRSEEIRDFIYRKHDVGRSFIRQYSLG